MAAGRGLTHLDFDVLFERAYQGAYRVRVVNAPSRPDPAGQPSRGPSPSCSSRTSCSASAGPAGSCAAWTRPRPPPSRPSAASLPGAVPRRARGQPAAQPERGRPRMGRGCACGCACPTPRSWPSCPGSSCTTSPQPVPVPVGPHAAGPLPGGPRPAAAAAGQPPAARPGHDLQPRSDFAELDVEQEWAKLAGGAGRAGAGRPVQLDAAGDGDLVGAAPAAAPSRLARAPLHRPRRLRRRTPGRCAGARGRGRSAASWSAARTWARCCTTTIAAAGGPQRLRGRPGDPSDPSPAPPRA